jgi:hypothetical protein
MLRKPVLWQSFLVSGLLLFSIGVMLDGRNPLESTLSVFSPGDTTVVLVATSQPETQAQDPVPAETNIPTYTIPAPTMTMYPTYTPYPTITQPPTITPKPKKLAFYQKSLDDKRGCMSLQIRGINVKGWTFAVKSVGLGGTFDGGGNARVCGLKWGRKLKFTVYNKYGNAVVGGVDVNARDQAIMIADWK